MNRIKTFFYFIGIYVLANVIIRILTYSSNKFFDDLPNLLFVPTIGLAVGYGPLIMASITALRFTDREDRTRKIIWVSFAILSGLWILTGLLDFILSLSLGKPLFQFHEEIGMFSAPDHWIYQLSLGIGMLYAVFQLKNNKIEGY